MHTIKLDATGEYQMFPPKTDADTVALGTVFKTHESSLPAAQQVCPQLLTRLGELLVDAQAALGTAAEEAVKARVAGTALHAAMDEATPLLDRAVVLLTRKYEQNLSVLGEWGLTTKTGARGQVRVIKPNSEPKWTEFLIKFAAKENGLPAANRLPEVPLARLTELAAIAGQNRTGRAQSTSVREQNVAARLQAVKPLYDLLQVACGLLMVLHFDGKVTPALQDWGYNIQLRKAAPAPAAEGDGQAA